MNRLTRRAIYLPARQRSFYASVRRRNRNTIARSMAQSFSLQTRAMFLERVWEHGFGASKFNRYAVAIVLACAASWLRIYLTQIWGSDFPFIFYFPVTLFSGLYGGFWPAFVSIAITSTATLVWVLPPVGQAVTQSIVSTQGLAVYLVVDTMIAWIGSRHRQVLYQRRQAAKSMARLLEQADSAARAKDAFLANISHELRTPLTPALMTASILQQDKSLAAPLRRAIDVIARNVQLEAKMVDDLLDLSRVANRKFTVKISECDLHDIIERALNVCLTAADGKTLNIVKKFEATQHRIRGDATRLQQVFWNLIQNAIKFTPENGFVTVHSRDADGQVYVDVRDTGCGIEIVRLGKIFEPFEQGAAHDARRGLGLGLAIAREIAVAHGGTLVANSDGPNRGSTFTVSLPASHSSTDS